MTAYDLLRRELAKAEAPDTVVDLGCGNARSLNYIRPVAPDIRWIGLDVDQSPYASNVKGEDVRIYDGVNIPFPDDSVPLYFSCQVFEHVRFPERVLAEVARTLVPGGLFIGSTSQLEPYHAYSFWNYTVYGFRIIVEASGLELVEVRPGIDGQTLIRRQYEGSPESFSKWFSQESPLNAQIDQDWNHLEPVQLNARKLQFCGQFAFVVRKPVGRSRPRRSSVAGPLTWRDIRWAAVDLLDKEVRRRMQRLRSMVPLKYVRAARRLLHK